jgi:exodeoxyribonuclease-3
MTRIITYNVNGIRAAMNKGWVSWLQSSEGDIVCLQEIKAEPGQFDVRPIENLGYYCYWYPAQKKGYSGTAILCKQKPQNVAYGCGHELYDFEGRILRADFQDYSVMSVYLPSGSSGESRQDVKMQFLDFFSDYIGKLVQQFPHLILCGDFNICHRPIDIHDPVGNKNSSGFLPEERQWLDEFLNSGFVDTFRYFNPEPHQYTWWSYRAGVRAKNKGWRIDYNLASKILEPQLLRSVILSNAMHSDHCPVLTDFNL